MSRENCPDRTVISRFQDQELSEQEIARWRPHLEHCTDCMRLLEGYEAALPVSIDGVSPSEVADPMLLEKGMAAFRSSPGAPSPSSASSLEAPLSHSTSSLGSRASCPHLSSPFFRIAATVLFAVGTAVVGGFWLYRSVLSEESAATSRVVRETLSTSAKSPGIGEAVAAGEKLASAAGKPVSLRFADGSRVLLEPGSEGTWEPLANGGYRLDLDNGAGEFDIVSGKGRFEVATSSGTVRVLGTRFSVRLIDIPAIPSDSPGSAEPRLGLFPGSAGVSPASSVQGLAVDLREGVVQIGRGGEWKTLSGSQKGIVLPGREPYPMESIDPENAGTNIVPIWNSLFRAFSSNQKSEFAFYLMVLSCQGEGIEAFLKSRLRTEGEEGACARIVWDALKSGRGEKNEK